MIAGVDLTSEPDDVADILIDLAQRETKTFSVQFARALVGAMKPVARLHKNPLKSAGFRVLKAPDVPSVLIELGYVSNREDLKLLMSESWRSKSRRRGRAGGRHLFRARGSPARRGRRELRMQQPCRNGLSFTIKPERRR